MTNYTGTGEYNPWIVPEVGDYLTCQWATAITKFTARGQVSWTFTGTKAANLGTTVALNYATMGFCKLPFFSFQVNNGNGWTTYYNLGYWNGLLEPPGSPDSHFRIYGITKSSATIYLGDTDYPHLPIADHPWKVTVYGC